MSILSQKFNTVYDTAPCSQIKNEDYIPAFNTAIEKTKAEIDAIIRNRDTPTFENTIAAMAYSGMGLDRISNIFFNLHSAETNDELDKLAQEIAPKLSALSNDITLNFELFEKIKAVYDEKDSLSLTPEQQTLLTKSYRNFVRNGALLTEEKKEELRSIDTELSILTLKFGENVLTETNAYQLHITNQDDLRGLTEGTIEAAKSAAETSNNTGWIFTLDYPSFLPFVTYADNRELRKEITLAAGSKAFRNNEYNNEKNI